MHYAIEMHFWGGIYHKLIIRFYEPWFVLSEKNAWQPLSIRLMEPEGRFAAVAGGLY